MSETVAPAPAQAPTAPISDNGSGVPNTIAVPNPARSFNDTIKALAHNTGAAPDAPADTPAVRFQRAPSTPDAPGSPDAPAGDAPIETAEPTGEIVLSDDAGDVTLSAQRNADGTFKTKLDPTEKLDFSIKDKATGEVKAYSKTLPEVVRLAKDGVTLQAKLQEVQPEVDYYRAEVPKWQQTVETLTTRASTLEQRLQEQMELNRELLTAPDDLVIQRREQYATEMSPEKQLARLQAQRAEEQKAREAEATQTKAREQATRVAEAAKAFTKERLSASLEKAETALGREAVVGAVHLFTQHLLVNGMYPPQKWNEMAAIINAPNGPFQTWVAAETAKRTQSDGVTAEARQRLEAERKKAQAVVNEAGRSMTPVGRGAIDSAAARPPAKNKQEVLARMIHAPLPATG